MIEYITEEIRGRCRSGWRLTGEQLKPITLHANEVGQMTELQRAVKHWRSVKAIERHAPGLCITQHYSYGHHVTEDAARDYAFHCFSSIYA